MIVHPFLPIYDERSRILILGTMASPQSRARGFYYAHPRNRFWPVMARLFEREIPPGREGRTAFLLEKGIALWDVLHACDIENAGDASIKNPVLNDFAPLFAAADIRAVFTTGRAATDLFARRAPQAHSHPPHYLPSTSPANCRNQTMETLCDAYREILAVLK